MTTLNQTNFAGAGLNTQSVVTDLPSARACSISNVVEGFNRREGVNSLT